VTPRPPFAAHANPIERSQNQKHRVVGRESAQQIHDREKDHVRHQRTAPPVAIGEQTKQQCPQRSHGQGSCGRKNDFLRRHVELGGQRIDQEDQHEEVKSVEGPSQETGGHGMPTVGGGEEGWLQVLSRHG
jgi:hypothetical protein